MRRLVFAGAMVISALFLTAGCQHDQSAQNQAADNAAADKAAADQAVADKAAREKAAAEAAKPIVIPAGTDFHVTLDQAVGSKSSKNGALFDTSLSDPVAVDGKVAIPQGARAYGVVSEAKAAGKFKGGAVLSLTLKSITVNNRTYDVQTSMASQESKGKGKRTAAMVGGGAAGGAAIGAIAGGGKGAAIGALVGAGAGTAGAGMTGNRDISLPAETRLVFTLTQPLELK